MDNLIFSGNAQVELQGDGVLQHMALSQGHVKYQFEGSDGTRMDILDYRPIGLRTIMKVMQSHTFYRYLKQVSTPAQVVIRQTAPQCFRVELRDTYDTDPFYRFCFSVGYQDELPEYPYLFQKVFPVNRYYHAVIALYEKAYQVSQVRSLLAAVA